MATMHNSGPMVTFGYVPGSGGANPIAGPGADYQGGSIVDTRYPYHPGMTGRSHVKAFLNYAYACLVDAAPAAASNTQIVSAGAGQVVPGAGSLALTLQSTNNALARAVNVPLVELGKGINTANAVKVLTIDPGHTKCNVVGGTATVTIPTGGDGRLVSPGSWICIPGGGGTGVCYTGQVVKRSLNGDGTGTLTVSSKVPASVTGAPLMLMDESGNSVVPYYCAGAVGEFDPHSAVSRVLTYISSSASDTGYSVLTVGYDVHNARVSELVSLTAGGTASGRKAFKHVLSCTLNKTGGGTTVGTIQIGTTDAFGFAMKSEAWEYANVFFNGAFISQSTGWAAGDSNTATVNTTSDVRGTYTAQSASDGSKRLAIYASLPARQVLSATWDDPSSLFGVTQA